MKGNTSALNSTYVIDGVTMDLTPAEILDDCLRMPQSEANGNLALEQSSAKTAVDPIVDETTDPSPTLSPIDDISPEECLEKVMPLLGSPMGCMSCYYGPYTKGIIAKTLLDCLWMHGHFRLSDLLLAARWRWVTKPLGNMAGFYSSVEAASEYMQGLGIGLKEYSFKESDKAFVVKLLRSAYTGYDRYIKQISEVTPKWDRSRICSTDLALIICGLAEAEAFDNIAPKVTINEYVEISKYYSTPESRAFVNGILDKLIKK